jgi:hypothetical protein
MKLYTPKLLIGFLLFIIIFNLLISPKIIEGAQNFGLVDIMTGNSDSIENSVTPNYVNNIDDTNIDSIHDVEYHDSVEDILKQEGSYALSGKTNVYDPVQKKIITLNVPYVPSSTTYYVPGTNKYPMRNFTPSYTDSVVLSSTQKLFNQTTPDRIDYTPDRTGETEPPQYGDIKNRSDSVVYGYASTNVKSVNPVSYDELSNSLSQIYTFTYRNGDKYKGEFANGEPSGVGIMKYVNGDEYKGNWLNGKPNGGGVMKYKKNNSFYAGYWLNGKPYKPPNT